MSIREYIKQHKAKRKPKTAEEKVAEYLIARRDDIEVDFEDEFDYSVEDYLETELNPTIIKRLEKLCVKYYDTMLSSDVDYFLAGYNLKELEKAVTTV